MSSRSRALRGGGQGTQEALGKRICAVRLVRGLTQEHPAERLGLTERCYASLERGDRTLMLDSVDALAEQLAATMTLMLKGTLSDPVQFFG